MNINGVKIFNKNAASNHNHENNLKPITLLGTVVTCDKDLNGHVSKYKLVVPDGSEYFFISDKYWDDVLFYHVKDEVKVKALLNLNTEVLIPQMIYPVGPYAPTDNPLDLATIRFEKIVKKIGRRLRELVIVPVGLLVVFMAL